MPFVYDDLAVICRNKEYLIYWLREKELLGDFTGPYLKYVKEMFTFRQDFIAGMVFCCDASTSKCT